jgi:adenylate cyclase
VTVDDPPATPPPTDSLSGRARSAYLRQELTAPAAALEEYARALLAAAESTGDADATREAGRIAERARHFSRQVDKLTAPDAGLPDPADRTFWRAVRHDLRGVASFVIMACEEVREAASGAVLAAVGDDLARTHATARRVIELVEGVINFGRNPDAAMLVPKSISDMLAKLPRADVRSAGDGGPGGRVLVVDDNEFGRDLVARMLVNQGHAVEVVPGGAEAFARLADADREPIDLILLDVMMPGLSGPEVLVRLKTDPRTRDLPVLMVSALGEDDTLLACIAAGAEDYLTRPVRAELLRARITACLDKKRLRDREAEYQERIRSLVRAIFPPTAVEEWERTGTIAPRHHELVGVLFLDVVGFTAFAEKYRDDPAPVIRLLQTLVERFEATAARHGVQKIKTIGDAFMGVAGLGESGGEPKGNPARTLVECGLGFLADAAAHPAGWQVRVGVHVGPVVTGVLGRVQFSFDVWGHTVNAANRVESHGRAGRVTVSDEAWAMLGGAAVGESREVAARGLGLVTVWDFLGWTSAASGGKTG